MRCMCSRCRRGSSPERRRRRAMNLATRCVVLASALLGTFQAGAQGIVTQKILSLNAAKVIAEAALAECKGRGFHTSVAVVDRSGTLLVVLRDEGANPATIDMAK